MQGCLNEADLDRLTAGRLPGEERVRFAVHVAECSRCRAALTEHRRVAAARGPASKTAVAVEAVAAPAPAPAIPGQAPAPRSRGRSGTIVVLLFLVAVLGGGNIVVCNGYVDEKQRRVTLERRREVAGRAAAAEVAAERRELYADRIGLAAAALGDRSAALAVAVLDGCDPELRGWEWHYLRWRAEPVRTRRRLSEGAVLAVVALDPARVAVGLADGSVVLIHLDDPELPELATVAAHDGAVRALALHPDGERLASAGDDGALRVWRFPDGLADGAAEALGRHVGTVRALAFAADGVLVAGGDDETVSIAVLDGSTPRRVLSGHDDAILAVAVSPDGAVAASADRSGRIIVWRRPELAAHVVIATGPVVSALAFVDERHLLAVGEAGALWRIAVDSGERTTLPVASAGGPLLAAALHVGGGALAVATGTGAVTILETDSGAVVGRLPSSSAPVRGVAWVGATIVAVGDDGDVRWHEASAAVDPRSSAAPPTTPALAVAAAPPLPGFVLEDISPRGRRLYHDGAGQIRLVDAADDLEDADRGLAIAGSQARFLAAPPGTERLVVVAPPPVLDESGEPLDIDTAYRLEVVTISGAEAARRPVALDLPRPRLLVVAPAGDGVALVARDPAVQWISLETEEAVMLDTARAAPHAVAVAADGEHLAAVIGGGADVEVQLWRLREEPTAPAAVPGKGATPRLVAGLREASADVDAVTFSAGGRRLATGGVDPVRIFDVTEGRLLLTLPTPGPVVALAFSADGRTLHAVGADGDVWTWATGPEGAGDD